MQAIILRVFAEIWREQYGTAPPVIELQAPLLDCGLDSLGFAVLVTRLELELGYDPFTLSDEVFYPRTMAEFVSFYEQNRPAD